MALRYQEHDLDSVLAYFAKDFEPRPNERIIHCEWLVAVRENKVVFKIYTSEETVKGKTK